MTLLDTVRPHNKRDFVNSLSRGLDVMRAFDRTRPSMTLSEVAERAGLSRAAARRFLLTFVRDGYAASDGKYFRLLPKVLDLGASIMASLDVAETMQPGMNELAERLQESCFAAILDGDSVIYVARAVSNRVVNVGITVGSRAPANAVSTGRVLLSGLDDASLRRYLQRLKLNKLTPYTVTSKAKLKASIEQVRRQGWSIVNQELEVGLQSISVPIRDSEGAIVAALNVCCPAPRVTRRDMETRVLPAILETAVGMRVVRRLG
jgi:IclR family pca regulon transcriptional regulator